MKFSLETVARIITENTEDDVAAKVEHIYEDYGAGLMWDTIVVSRINSNDVCDRYQALDGPLQKKLKNLEDVDFADIELLVNTANRMMSKKDNRGELTKIYKSKAKKWNETKDIYAQFYINNIKEYFYKGDIKKAGDYWNLINNLFNKPEEFEQLHAYTAQLDDRVVYDVTDYLNGCLTEENFKKNQERKREYNV